MEIHNEIMSGRLFVNQNFIFLIILTIFFGYPLQTLQQVQKNNNVSDANKIANPKMENSSKEQKIKNEEKIMKEEDVDNTVLIIIFIGIIYVIGLRLIYYVVKKFGGQNVGSTRPRNTNNLVLLPQTFHKYHVNSVISEQVETPSSPDML